MLKIVSVPNSVLNTPAQSVKKIDSKIRRLIHDMEETLEAQIDPEGVGLAAPQVGVSLQIFIIKPSPKAEMEAFINPVITDTKDSKEPPTDEKKKKSTPLEGCLSIPRVWAPLKRPQEVTIEYMDLEGKQQKKVFKKFDAVIIQHEVDHLNGVLFTHRALEQGTQLYKEEDEELKPVDF